MASMTLDTLVSQLRAAYGDELRCVVLYGSAAVGEQLGKRSDLNVLVIVQRIDVERLRREAAVARAWGEAGNPPPLTLTDAEWTASADIFPMEYSDILERHRVLYGEAPFEGVRPNREHLRLQTENEAMGKLIQFRQGILRTGGDHRRIMELLAESISTFMVIFRSVVRLHGETPPKDQETLCALVGQLARFDASPFARVVRHVRGSDTLTKDDTSAVLSGYLEGLHQLVEHIDRMGRS
jgi:predicted nucleotidyltransferase